MNEGEREALLKQVELYMDYIKKKLAGIGLPVQVALLHPGTGCIITQAELVQMAEKR